MRVAWGKRKWLRRVWDDVARLYIRVYTLIYSIYGVCRLMPRRRRTSYRQSVWAIGIDLAALLSRAQLCMDYFLLHSLFFCCWLVARDKVNAQRVNFSSVSFDAKPFAKHPSDLPKYRGLATHTHTRLRARADYGGGPAVLAQSATVISATKPLPVFCLFFGSPERVGPGFVFFCV